METMETRGRFLVSFSKLSGILLINGVSLVTCDSGKGSLKKRHSDSPTQSTWLVTSQDFLHRRCKSLAVRFRFRPAYLRIQLCDPFRPQPLQLPDRLFGFDRNLRIFRPDPQQPDRVLRAQKTAADHPQGIEYRIIGNRPNHHIRFQRIPSPAVLKEIVKPGLFAAEPVNLQLA